MSPALRRATSGDDITLFRLRGEHDVIVPVVVDGQAPYRFLLDTGSTRSAITDELAGKLGLAVSGRTRMVTPSGARSQTLVRIRQLTMGAAHASDVEVMVLPVDDLGTRGNVDRLIGQDVLGRFAFTIDYEGRRILWHADGDDSEVPGVRLPLSSVEGRVVVH